MDGDFDMSSIRSEHIQPAGGHSWTQKHHQSIGCIDIRGYFTQQQQNTYSSQAHIKHSPTHKKHYTDEILQARILEWVAVPFSRGSSQPRNWTQESNPGLPHGRWILYQLSHKGSPRILEWVTYPPVDLPDSGIKLGSSALQGDSLPAELPGEPKTYLNKFKTKIIQYVCS